MIGSLMHPVYSIANAMYLGHQSEAELAGFGLGSLMLGIIYISNNLMFSMALVPLGAQAFGAKDYKLAWIYFNR